MKIKVFLFCLCALLASSCQQEKREASTDVRDTAEVNTRKESPEKMIEILVGEWELDEGAAGNADQQDGAMQRIRFTEEARYIGYSDDEKVDSGAYRMNEQLRNLYLESEADEEPREYEIDLQENRLTLKRSEAQTGGSSSYSYRRVAGR
ncbi:MAG: hypothetical protein M3Y60_11840 [Bacteroidota bacterium]|nr:hypothetical protein [Bacteroidota bacterium]